MATDGSNVVIAAFTEDEVRRLTGIRLRQLRYWDRTAFFRPSLIDNEDGDQVGSLYSFRDLVCLQVLNGLRNDNGVSLQHLREVKDKLAKLGADLWAKTTLYVLKKQVVFHNSETGDLEEVLTGQGYCVYLLKLFEQIWRARSDLCALGIWTILARSSASAGWLKVNQSSLEPEYRYLVLKLSRMRAIR